MDPGPQGDPRARAGVAARRGRPRRGPADVRPRRRPPRRGPDQRRAAPAPPRLGRERQRALPVHPPRRRDGAGGSPLYGDQAAPSPRTLANWALLAGTARLDRAAAARPMFSNRSFPADRLRDAVVAACRRAPAPPAPRRRPAVAARRPGPPRRRSAGRATPSPPGTVRSRHRRQRRRAVARGPGRARARRRRSRGPTPTTRPIRRPRRASHATDDQVRAAVRAAWGRLASAGLDPTAPLGALQHTRRGAATVGVPGGTQLDGVADVATWADMNGTLLPRDHRGQVLSPSGLTGQGYPVNFGTSFVMTVDLTPAGPEADVLLTYGNSGDPASPHFRDQLDDVRRGHGSARRATPPPRSPPIPASPPTSSPIPRPRPHDPDQQAQGRRHRRLPRRARRPRAPRRRRRPPPPRPRPAPARLLLRPRRRLEPPRRPGHRAPGPRLPGRGRAPRRHAARRRRRSRRPTCAASTPRATPATSPATSTSTSRPRATPTRPRSGRRPRS